MSWGVTAAKKLGFCESAASVVEASRAMTRPLPRAAQSLATSALATFLKSTPSVSAILASACDTRQ